TDHREPAPHADQAPSSARARRRWTELPMPIASRYFATVRRARPKPFALSRSTNVSSLRILAPSLAISARIALLTASADTASPPSDEDTPEVEKYFSSKVPRAQLRYLLLVTRLTVDSCISITSATWRSVIGLRYATPLRKNASCCFT